MHGSAVESTPQRAWDADVPRLRLEVVHSFLVVVREENVTRAAESLFLTQPGLTRRIRALERQLDCQLLDTSGPTVQPTAAGRVLLPHARTLVAVAVRLGEDLASLTRGPGASPSAPTD